jgi:putative transposase
VAVFRRVISEPAAQRRPAYPSDLTDAQWALLEPRLRDRDSADPGRPTSVDLRDIVNALLYMKPTGCQWRYLPHDLPPRSTVHYYLAKWTADGTWETVMPVLRERSRRQQHRDSRPTAGALDSQTVKSVGTRNQIGWDGAK